jgi:hypothetical protein
MIHHHLSALLLLPVLGAAVQAASATHETTLPSLGEFTLIDDGPTIGGWLEASYNDFAGNFAVGRNRLQVDGNFNKYGYRISLAYDDATSSMGLSDAYATATAMGVGWTFGQFRAPTTSSHLLTESRQFFMDRTGFGGGGLRQTGLMASGSFDSFGWSLAMMDDEGVIADPNDDDEDLHARVSFDVIGSSMSACEGSYDSLGTTNLSVAAALDNGSSGDSTYIEATYSTGTFWGHIELVDADSGSPLTLAATYAVTTQYEVGLRTEDPDDGTDSTTTIAINRYISGHDCKWTLQFDDGDDYDTDGSSDQRLSAGFLVSF